MSKAMIEAGAMALHRELGYAENDDNMHKLKPLTCPKDWEYCALAAYKAMVEKMGNEQLQSLWYAAKVPLPNDFPLQRSGCDSNKLRATLLELAEGDDE